MPILLLVMALAIVLYLGSFRVEWPRAQYPMAAAMILSLCVVGSGAVRWAHAGFPHADAAGAVIMLALIAGGAWAAELWARRRPVEPADWFST